MLIKCIRNNYNFFSTERLVLGVSANQRLSISLGSIYPVFGVAVSGSKKLYFIEDEETAGSYPRWYDSKLFEVVDPTLPSEWVIGGKESARNFPCMISFPEWANNPDFFLDLINNDKGCKEDLLIRKWRNSFQKQR